MLLIDRTKNGYILIGNNGSHTHGDKKYCELIKRSILSKRKPTLKDLEYLQKNDIRGPNHYRVKTVETIEQSIFKLVSRSKYNRWGKKQKYYNRGGRKIV